MPVRSAEAAVVVYCRIPEKLDKRLVGFCNKFGVTKTAVLRAAIKDYLVAQRDPFAQGGEE